MERNFKGVWIPKEVYLNKELSWSEKILFIEIDSLDNEKGCFASNDYFADFIGVSNTRISKMTSKLKEQGLIRQESFDGRQRVLHSIMKYDKADLNKSSKQNDTKVQSRDEQKFKHNNIPNNPPNNIKEVAVKITYADNVKMLEVEYTKLITQYTKIVIDEKIIDLSLWKGSKGKATKSDYLTLLTWLRKDTKSNTPAKEDTWGGMKQFN